MNLPSHFLTFTILTLACVNSPAAPADSAENKEPKITIRERTIFDGDQGWTHNGVTYRLACGAAIKEAPNGELLCWWLSGTDSEPATDNNVLMARSTDKGHTWSEPSIFVPAGEMAGAVTSMYATSDGRMIAYGAKWPAELRYTVWYYFRMESNDNGHTWSAPTPVSFHNDNIAIGSPIRLANGDLLFGASFFDKRPKPLEAPIMALVNARTEAEALATPAGEGKWHDTKFATHRHGASVLISTDEDGKDMKEFGYIANRPLGLLEPSCIQLKDGRIVMFLRAEMAGFLWRAESTDNGRTWTDAWQTDIPNPTSAIHILRLADGRIALLHNACGEVGKMIPRDPLSIWISDDELETWSINENILHGGWLAYPFGLILDDKLVFGYDRNRRQAQFVEVDITPAE